MNKLTFRKAGPDHSRKITPLSLARICPDFKTETSRYSTERLSISALRKDGRQLFCEFSLVMIQDRNDQIIGFASVMRNVTT